MIRSTLLLIFFRTRTDSLVEALDQKTSGRKQFQYIDNEGKLGRIVSRKEHILALKAQGKLKHINADDFTFSTKRKRSSSRIDVQELNDSPGDTLMSMNLETFEVPPAVGQHNILPVKESGTDSTRETINYHGKKVEDKVGQADDKSYEDCVDDIDVEDSTRINENEVEDEFEFRTVKLRNEQMKKKKAMESLKMSTQTSDLKEVCRVMDQFRAKTISNNSSVVDEELKLK